MTEVRPILQGRHALVTGGSRGLGREVALTLSRAGADVAVLARASGELDGVLAELQGSALTRAQKFAAIAIDLASPAAADRAFADATGALGSVDVLVNNAGIIGALGVLDRTTADEWAGTIQVNLLAPVSLMRAVLPGMRARGYGKIINLSGGGATSPRPHFTAYAAAKTALVRTTETVADECRNTGIDINAVAPGAMNTRLLDQVLDAGPDRVGEREYRRALEQRDNGGSPPAKAAELICWLASPDSDGITGRVLSAVWDPWPMLTSVRAELASSDIYTLRRIVPEDRGVTWGRERA